MNKINYDELFTDTDINTGEDIFYLDSNLEKPYTGIVVDYFKGLLNWEFQVKDGFRNGVEKTYYDTGELKEVNEVNYNTVDGVAKEFYKNGNMKSISIVIRNCFIDTVCFNETGNKISQISKNLRDKGCCIDTIFFNEFGDKIQQTTENKDVSPYYLLEKEIDEYRKKYRVAEWNSLEEIERIVKNI